MLRRNEVNARRYLRVPVPQLIHDGCFKLSQGVLLYQDETGRDSGTVRDTKAASTAIENEGVSPCQFDGRMISSIPNTFSREF